MMHYIVGALIVALGGLAFVSLSPARRHVWPREGHGRTYFGRYSDR